MTPTNDPPQDRATESASRRTFTDVEVGEWMERHDLEMAFGGNRISEARCAMEDAATVHLLAAPRASVEGPDSSTYGNLPDAVRPMIRAHEWDNMNVSEQRDWCLRALAAPPAPREAEGLSHDTEMAIRRALWLGHGHVGMYGDDGEMQCAACAPPRPVPDGVEEWVIDWKREPLAKVVAWYERIKVSTALVAAPAASREAGEPVRAVLLELVQRYAMGGERTSDGKLVVLNHGEWKVLVAATEKRAEQSGWEEGAKGKPGATNTAPPAREVAEAERARLGLLGERVEIITEVHSDTDRLTALAQWYTTIAARNAKGQMHEIGRGSLQSHGQPTTGETLRGFCDHLIDVAALAASTGGTRP